MNYVKPTFARVRELFGDDYADGLIRQYPGLILCVPMEDMNRGRLALVFGVERARMLVKDMPGNRIEIPSRLALQAKERREAVRAMLRSGVPRAEISRQTGITQRQINNIERELSR